MLSIQQQTPAALAFAAPLGLHAAATAAAAPAPLPTPHRLALSPLRRAPQRAHARPRARPFGGAYCTAATPATPPPSDPSPGAGGGGGGGSKSLANSLYKFTRPHTIRGTILGAFAGCARALLDAPSAVIDWALLPRAALGVVALLCGNAFIVGINQIYDVRIDRINKPFLPLAEGSLSTRLAWLVVVVSAVLGLFIVRRYFSPLIFALYAFGMCIGGLYSVPPFRFKRYPFMAALTISCVRGFLLNFGVYHATKNALGLTFTWSPPISFLAVFMSVFAIVIALAKDLPDIKGDVQIGVPTFASRIGPARMVNLVLSLLALNYVFAIATALFAPAAAFNKPVMVAAHAALLGHMAWYRSSRIDPTSQTSIKRFYAFIWRLFYAEYLLFPFI